jgi:prepilin-type N-terminal cleavage/methylation domain-containing protein
MLLLKISIAKRGFSLIELVVVLGMLAGVASLTLVISMQSYHSSSFADTQTLLITALYKARSQALSCVCIGTVCTAGKAHGVHITPTQLIIFQGDYFNAADDTNEYIPISNRSVSFSDISDVVFDVLTANALTAGDITLTDTRGRIATVSVGAKGQILSN